MDRIQKLIDAEDIRSLRVLYSHHLDSANVEALDDIFAKDAVVEVTIGTMNGLDEIRHGLAQAITLFDRDKRGNYPFLHVVTNHWINIIDHDTAEGRCYLVDFETASKPDPNPLLLLGLYADEYRRVEGRWLISHSRLETVWPERNRPVNSGQPGKGKLFPASTEQPARM